MISLLLMTELAATEAAVTALEELAKAVAVKLRETADVTANELQSVASDAAIELKAFASEIEPRIVRLETLFGIR